MVQEQEEVTPHSHHYYSCQKALLLFNQSPINAEVRKEKVCAYSSRCNKIVTWGALALCWRVPLADYKPSDRTDSAKWTTRMRTCEQCALSKSSFSTNQSMQHRLDLHFHKLELAFAASILSQILSIPCVGTLNALTLAAHLIEGDGDSYCSAFCTTLGLYYLHLLPLTSGLVPSLLQCSEDGLAHWSSRSLSCAGGRDFCSTSFCNNLHQFFHLLDSS